MCLREKTKLKHDCRGDIFQLFFSLKLSHFESQKIIASTTYTLWKRLHYNKFNDFNIPVQTLTYLSLRCRLRKGLQAKRTRQTSCFSSMSVQQEMISTFLSLVNLKSSYSRRSPMIYSVIRHVGYKYVFRFVWPLIDWDIPWHFRILFKLCDLLNHCASLSHCLMCSKTSKCYLWSENARR